MVQRYRSLARRVALVGLAATLGAALALAGCPGPAPRPEPPTPPFVGRTFAGLAEHAVGDARSPTAAAAPAPARGPSVPRHPLARGPGARAAGTRRSGWRLVDARSGAAHRAEQPAHLERARQGAPGRKRFSPG